MLIQRATGTLAAFYVSGSVMFCQDCHLSVHVDPKAHGYVGKVLSYVTSKKALQFAEQPSRQQRWTEHGAGNHLCKHELKSSLLLHTVRGRARIAKLRFEESPKKKAAEAQAQASQSLPHNLD